MAQWLCQQSWQHQLSAAWEREQVMPGREQTVHSPCVPTAPLQGEASLTRGSRKRGKQHSKEGALTRHCAVGCPRARGCRGAPTCGQQPPGEVPDPVQRVRVQCEHTRV